MYFFLITQSWTSSFFHIIVLLYNPSALSGTAEFMVLITSAASCPGPETAKATADHHTTTMFDCCYDVHLMKFCGSFMPVVNRFMVFALELSSGCHFQPVNHEL